MKRPPISFFFIIPLLALCLFAPACKEKRKPVRLGEKRVVARPEELKQTVSDVLQGTLEEAVADSAAAARLPFRNTAALALIYKDRNYEPLWTRDSVWLPHADSLLRLLGRARRYGLFPEDYRQKHLDSLHIRMQRDTTRTTRLDAALWAETDLYFTSALLDFATDLRVSRLQADSLRRRDSSLVPAFFRAVVDSFQHLPTDSFAARFEPPHAGYRALRKALPGFLARARFRTYTRINPKDSANLLTVLRKRLSEDSVRTPSQTPDSTELAAAVKKYQKKKGLKPDGRVSPELIAYLNSNDTERYLQIVINMERYKLLPPLPEEYIWVNIPTYMLQVYRGDSLTLTSKVVVGKTESKTPVLYSAVNNMMTYPQWTIPPSIISKDILPALQRDPGYLARKGYSLLDTNRNPVNPYAVKWSKYKKGIPYKVVQGSGDDNALGVLKFNFPNKFSVYLHDTNQRSFFGRPKRALSHGCVRVESWRSLATYLLRRDSAMLALDTASKARAVRVDSLASWLAQKKRRYVPLRRPMPVFLTYQTVSVKEGRLVYLEDIYGEDRRMRQTYFAKK
ncbi:L,D-transpeptidase family protein [Flaviaesturariibacter amylovorans]|uniref:Murein L,D-transpeptidase n=1 Tax=Flaviaesturariibacter amylovorans TaxID=1084520 RepID=A0ABP8H373_9BACT